MNAGLKCCMKSLVKGFRMPPAASIDTACMQESRKVGQGAGGRGHQFQHVRRDPILHLNHACAPAVFLLG
jgi:hypothetical protein